MRKNRLYTAISEALYGPSQKNRDAFEIGAAVRLSKTHRTHAEGSAALADFLAWTRGQMGQVRYPYAAARQA